MILLHKPAYFIDAFTTVRDLYDRIQSTLEDREIRFAVRRQNGKLHRPVMHGRIKNICYHSRDRGIINVKIGYLPEYFYMDRFGYSGWAEIAVRPEIYRNAVSTSGDDGEFEALSQEYRRKRASKYPQPHDAEKDLPARFLLVLTQVPGDAVLQHQWMSTDEMIDVAIEQSRKCRVPMVVKKHPRDHTNFLTGKIEQISERPDVFVSNASVHDLFERALGVCTVNSGTGFEALLYQLPVFSFGRSDYSMCTVQIRTPSDADKISATLSGTLPRVDARRFVSFFLRQYLVNPYDECFPDILMHRLATLHCDRFYARPELP